ncbi:MAG: helix-turn-helix domain-containing protein [Reyranellales bacterium]
MLPGELVLRVATAAILLVVGLVFLRDRARMDSGPFGGLLALSVAVLSVAGIRSFAWLWPLQIPAMGASALLWIWAGTIFDDDFRPGWRDALAWSVLPIVAAVNLQARQPWIGTVESVLALVFVLLAAGRALSGLRDDLLERRRRLRRLLATLAVVYSAGQILMDIFDPGRPGGATGRLVEAALLAALALGFALVGLRGESPLRRPPAVAPEPTAPDALQTPAIEADDQDDALLARLIELMETEKAYRQEGFGLNALVAALDVPEYRLRRLINQRLGHRNFSSFVNGYRLAETMAALADAGQADVPILTIALDAGFQSIGPFNRAFKAHTGMTPSAYRKQAESRGNRPNPGIGQPAQEIGKT